MGEAHKIVGVVLAAGTSSRMGAVNKLLAEVGGVAMIARTVAHAAASNLAAVVVVTGHEHEKVESVLRGQDVRFIHNGVYAEGMASSLKAGISAVSADFDGAMILLGDMPLVTSADIDLMLEAFGSPGDICVPVSDGQRGNPVLWGSNWFEEIQKLAGDHGAKSLLRLHEESVVEVAMPGKGVLQDFDTQAEIDRQDLV